MYDVKEIRKQFPMLNPNKKMQGHKLVFLDNASTTFKPQCVIDAMNEYYTECTANSHRGDYDLMYLVDKRVRDTRALVAKFVNCDIDEVVFTSGDTMALNSVAFGYGLKYLTKGDVILTSEGEHASNLLPWFRVSQMTGAEMRYIPLDEDGCITIDNLKKVLDKNVKVVSLAHVGNVMGYDLDVKAIAKLCHEVGAIFVVDGAQSVPHMKTDFKDWDIDFLAFSAHKMCGPTGIGCLIGKKELLEKMDPFILGGGMNETFTKPNNVVTFDAPAKFEGGTQNISGIFGFKAALEFLMSIGMDNIQKHELELKKYAMDKLKDVENVIVYNPKARNGIVTFNVKDRFSQDESTYLNYKGIAIRSGQHCDKLLNCYLKTPATCRASFYLYTTKEEIDYLVENLINGGDILDAYFN